MDSMFLGEEQCKEREQLGQMPCGGHERDNKSGISGNGNMGTDLKTFMNQQHL